MSSSSSPPKDQSSGSASPDFKKIDNDDEDLDQEEISSDPQLDHNLVYTPQPISSYNPNLSPQPISSYNPNLPDPYTIYSQIDPETEYYINSQGLGVSDVMNQKQTLDYWNRRKQSLNSQEPAGNIPLFDLNIPDPSIICSQIDPHTAAYIKSQGIDMTDVMNQKQSHVYWNQSKQSLPQDPAGTSRTESPVLAKKPRKETRKERAIRWMDSPAVELTDIEKQAKEMESEKEKPLKKRKQKSPEFDQKQPEKLRVKEEDGFLLPLSESEREDDYETLKFLLDYVLSGGVLRPDFDTSVVSFINGILAEKCKITVSLYQFRKKVMELHQKFQQIVQQNGGKNFSEANFLTGREYEMAVMCKTIWNDGQESRGSGFDCNYDSWDDPGFETDHSGGSDLDPADPFFNNSNDPIVDGLKACFGFELNPTPVPVTRVSAAGKKLIFKPPRGVNVEMKSVDAEFESDMARAIEMSLKEVAEDTSKGKSIEDQAAPKIDTLPLKKRKIVTLAEETDFKVYKRRKLSASLQIHDENRKRKQEENMAVDQGNVANPGADDSQVNVANMEVDQGNVADPGADDAQVNVANMAVDVGQENVDKKEVDGSPKK